MRAAILILGCLAAQPALPTVSWSGEEGVVQGIVEAHNRVRAGVGVPQLVWSEDLAEVAREWAVYLAGENSCRLTHRPQSSGNGQQYGENLYWASAIRYSNGTREIQEVGAEKVVAAWAGESNDYDYATNSCRKNKACGHYTQVIWKDTLRVGCGRAVCPDKGQVWVCNYDPPGNFSGEKPY